MMLSLNTIAHDHLIDLFSFIQRCLYKYSWINNKETDGSHSLSPSCTNMCTNTSNLEDQWTLLLRDAEYSSYSVVALSPCHNMIAFGNLKGKIKLQDVGE